MITRVALFILIMTALLLNVWWVALPAAALYVWQYRGYELFFLALVVDGYYGQFYSWPWYATGSVGLIPLPWPPSLYQQVGGFPRPWPMPCPGEQA